MQRDFERYAGELAEALNRDEQEARRPRLDTVSAAELQKKELPPLREPVPGLIVQGVTILASPPKYGKSWLCLDLCLSVAAGRDFLGFPTRRSGCLYLALEDSQRRLKARMGKLLSGAAAPADFSFCTAADTTDTGLLDELEGFAAEHPAVGLYVIDTLQKVRGGGRNEGAYAADYRELALLKGFADRRRVALVLVHHLRKQADDADPFNRVSGTAAISGAADSILVISKPKRQAETALLNVTGRDVETRELELRFEKERCRWENLGETEALAERRAREEYEASPLVRTVRKLVAGSGLWMGTATELERAARYIVRQPLAGSPTQLNKEIAAVEHELFKNDGICHTVRKNGNGGKKHIFELPGAGEGEQLVFPRDP